MLTAPALYQSHKTSAFDLFEKLDPEQRNDACIRVVRHIFRKLPPGDSYDSTGETTFTDISYEEALDICELLERMEADSPTYYNLSNLVDCITWKYKQKPFSQQQRADIAQRLRQIVDKKFPNPRYITHNGFQILANAHIAKLSRLRPFPWEVLIAAGKQVPNLSDRVFVLATLCGTCTEVDITARAVLLREAKVMADQIPSMIDRIDRYEAISRIAREVDLAFCKQCIRETVGNTTKIDDPEADETRRRMVDFAHGIDPELANSLAASFDDDEARERARERIEFQEMSKKISQGSTDAIPKQAEPQEIASTMWTLLGKLNANRVEPLPVGNTRIYVEMASRMPLNHAYPILSWAVENDIRRRSHAEEARRLIRGLYEATLIGCELAYLLGGRSAGKLRDSVRHAAARTDHSGIVVHSGERETAIEFLRQWLAQNVQEYLKICDPFFGPEDLEVLQLVIGSSANISVSILTSKKHQDARESGVRIEEIYQRQWRRISDQSPPQNEIVVVGTPSGDLPIHDRWWLTRGRGLRLGTSFNSIGGKKESEISVLTEPEARQLEQEIDEYLNFRKREHDGERLNIHAFSISSKDVGV